MTRGDGEAVTERTGTGAGAGAGPLAHPEAGSWRLRGVVLPLDRPLVMGVVNVTPDSFSDGGTLSGTAAALDRARAMAEAGAALIDVGGESTRPGAAEVPAQEELRRVLPVVHGAVAAGLLVSVDTRKAEVARACLEEGAHVINDVSGLAFDAELADAVAAAGAGLVIMHMRGTPADMVEHAHYGSVASEVARELGEGLRRAHAAGIDPGAVAVDPGIGFAKTAAHSLALLADLTWVRALGHPIVVGPSRKSFIGHVDGSPPGARLGGTVAACVLAYLEGARIVRVHDVAPVVQALAVIHAARATAGSENRA